MAPDSDWSRTLVDADDRGPALYLLVEPLLWVRAPDPRSVGLGEGEVDEEIGLGFGQQLRNGREACG